MGKAINGGAIIEVSKYANAVGAAKAGGSGGGGGAGGEIAGAAIGALGNILGGGLNLAQTKRNLEAMKEQGKISAKQAEDAYKMAQLELKMADKNLLMQKMQSQTGAVESERNTKLIIAVVAFMGILAVGGIATYIIVQRRKAV